MDGLLRWLVIALATTTHPHPPSVRKHAAIPTATLSIQSQSKTEYLKQLATRIALTHALPPDLIHRIITVESGWRISAFKYEPHIREATIGLMQLLPSTARLPAAALLIPEVNVTAGCRYLRWCIDAAKGNTRRALVCYNGGPRCLTRRCPAAEAYAARI